MRVGGLVYSAILEDRSHYPWAGIQQVAMSTFLGSHFRQFQLQRVKVRVGGHILTAAFLLAQQLLHLHVGKAIGRA